MCLLRSLWLSCDCICAKSWPNLNHSAIDDNEAFACLKVFVHKWWLKCLHKYWIKETSALKTGRKALKKYYCVLCLNEKYCSGSTLARLSRFTFPKCVWHSGQKRKWRKRRWHTRIHIHYDLHFESKTKRTNHTHTHHNVYTRQIFRKSIDTINLNAKYKCSPFHFCFSSVSFTYFDVFMPIAGCLTGCATLVWHDKSFAMYFLDGTHTTVISMTHKNTQKNKKKKETHGILHFVTMLSYEQRTMTTTEEVREDDKGIYWIVGRFCCWAFKTLFHS